MDTFLTYLLTTGVAYLAEMHRCESPRAFLIDQHVDHWDGRNRNDISLRP